MTDTLAAPTREHQTPRQYQTELFLEARKRNVIAYLDTGSGKTLVSVLLIKDKAGSLNEGRVKRVTVFLAPKVLLVQQQAEVLRKHTHLRVAHYCGDMNVDYWDRRRWAKELAEQDVWVMTPQILLNILRHGFIKITHVNLLVCDECHRAVKKDPYNCIMQEFYHDRATEGKRPHIFGMTASPVNTRAKQTQMKVADAVWQLERNMDAQVITVINRGPVVAAAPLPELKLVYYVRQHVSDSLKEVEAGLAAAIWQLHRGETVMAQLEAARAQQAAEAACIGLTLDEEKITSLSASTRRHLQGLALVVQELGPWCAAAVLRELLRPKQANNLLGKAAANMGPETKYTDDGPDSAAIRKTPGAYMTTTVPSSDLGKAAALANGNGKTASLEQQDVEMMDAVAVKKPTPETPEVQALNVALKEVARMLTQTLPISKRLRLASAFALGEIDPAAHNFKVLLRHVISRVMDAIPSDLIDKELGIQPASATAAAVEEIAPDAQQAQQPQQAQQAQQADQTELVDGADKEGSSSQAQQAKQGQQAKQAAQNGDAEEDEEGQERLPLFTHKVMALVQHLLKYKDDVASSKLAAYSSPQEADSHHWSAILFVTRKMTAMGLAALFKHAPCLKAWKAATLVGYGGNVASSCLTSKAQHGLLQQLKAGELDIVISTAVAEEGLDVKQCQLVVRFDLPSTLLAFVQSRGRARAHGSHYVLMLEKDNRDHQLLLSQVVGYEANMRFHAARRPGLGEAEEQEEDGDIKLTELDINHIPVEMREYRVPSTGARVTLASAKPLLYMFCAKLPADRYTVLRPRFSTQVMGEDARLQGYRSSAVLPNNSPVRIAQGQIQRTRALAQASASLEACKQLHQSRALDENLLPDVPTFEIDPDDDSDEEVLFAKAMPVTARKKRNASAVAAAMIDMNGFQIVMSSAEAKAVQKQITLKPKVPEILKEPAKPDDRGVTTWTLYRFTVTAKMGFIYHIPGPDEDPDDPSTNTCPLDPVLENKLNMRAALPKQIFGMLVPKELPDVRALMPYSLRLPHARDALDCTFDLMGSVSFSQEELDDIRAFHAAMMEGPQKKKDPKKVAEELRRLTDAARKVLGELPDADELDPLPKPAQAPATGQGASATAPVTDTQTPAAGQGTSASGPAPDSQDPAAEQDTSAAATTTDTQTPAVGQGTSGSAPVTDSQTASAEQQASMMDDDAAVPAARTASQSASQSASQTCTTADQQQPPASSDTAAAHQASDGDDMNTIALPDEAEEDLTSKPDSATAQPPDKAEVTAAPADSSQGADQTAADQSAGTVDPASSASPDDPAKASSAKPDEPAKTQDPVHVWDELTKYKEGDNENFEDKFTSNYFFVPLKLWLDWEDVCAKLPADPPKEVDWDAVRHVKHGWKPLTTLEEVAAEGAGNAMEVDGDTAIPSEISNGQAAAPGDQLVPEREPNQHPAAVIPSKEIATPSSDTVVPNGHASAAGGNSVPKAVPVADLKAVKMGPLDPERLANSVLVTTYNSTPYFYEGIDPELTPESRFPDDKLKLQAVVEQEAEDDFLKPKPPRETDTPADGQTGKRAESADQPEAEGEAAAAPVTEAAEPVEAAKPDDPDAFVVQLIASKQAATFTDYFKTRWDEEGLDPNQPLLRVGLANRRRDTPYEGGVFLVPQLCIAHPLTQQCFIMSKLVHQVLHYVNQRLLASELQPKLVKAPYMQPNIVYVLEALTPKACQEEISYERFELLGDAFLKYAVSLFLFHKFPEAHEGQLAGRKGAIVANTNLVKIAIHNGLKHYMLAPLPRGKGAKKRAELGLMVTQQLKSKAWADIVESLIGLVYLEAGKNATMEFLVYLGIISEVPLGFEREPAVQITEVNLDDDQLAVDVAAAEKAAAAMEFAADKDASAAAVEAAAMDVANDQAALEAAFEGATAAELAGAADVDMADAQGSAEPAAEPAVATMARPLAAATLLESASNPDGAATAVVTAEQTTANDHADEDTAAPHSMAGDSDAESDIIMDQSGYGRAASYTSDASHDALHAAQNGNANTVGNGSLPELSTASANGHSHTSASAKPNSAAQTRNGLSNLAPLDGSKAAGVAKPLQGTAQPPIAAEAQSHKVLVSVGNHSGAVPGFVDPNVIDLCDVDDTLQEANARPEANDHGPLLEPKEEEQEVFQSGYLQQSGYGDIELTSSDSEESDSADNPEEISIAEQEEEGEGPWRPSPSHPHPWHPMDTKPLSDITPVTAPTAGAGAAASGLADGTAMASASGLNGTAPVQPSGDPVKIKIEPGIGKDGGDQNQIEMDAAAFLAMEDDDSEDELPQARPHRGQVWRPPQELIDSYSSGVEAVLKYQFKNRALLQEALTHTSWPDATQQGYQRLEFLGDAVLDLLMTRSYFTTYRDGSPGTLSDLRSASVNNTRLASVAVLHQIHTFIRHCSTPLFHDISLFVEQLQQAVSDQEKKIIEQQVALRQQQRQAQLAAALAAGEEPGDVSMTDGEVGKKHVAGEEDLNHTPAKRQRSNSLERIQSSDPLSKSAELLPGAENAPAVDAQLTAQPEPAQPTQPQAAQLDPSAELNQTIQKVSPFQDEFADLDDSIQVTLASMTDETDNPEAAAATDSAKQPTDAEMETQAQLKPAGSDLASVPADCTPTGSTALPDSAIAAAIATTDQEPTNAANGIKDFGNGIEHPLGGPKVDKPKRRKKYVRDSVKGKARELSADDDAKAAALQWASEAAFGNTEVAAPKVLGDIVESLVGAVYIDSKHNFDLTWQVFQPLMSPLLSPTTVPKHPIRHLHERAQQDGKLLKFVCSVSNPRAEGLSPMEEADQKRKNGEVLADITPEQAAKDAEQVLERQKAWQQRWRERHEREGTLYDAVAVVEDVIIGRCVGATNKALAKRRAAEDALRIIAEKEAAVAAAEVAKQASQLQAAIGAPSIEKMATDTPAVPAEPPSEAAMLATPDRAE